jgi:hypothetical protein
MQFDHQPRIGAVQPLQQTRQFRADDMVADADHQPAVFDREGAKRGVVRSDQVPRRRKEGLPLRR